MTREQEYIKALKELGDPSFDGSSKSPSTTINILNYFRLFIYLLLRLQVTSPLAFTNISCRAVENIICAFDPQCAMIVIFVGQLENPPSVIVPLMIKAFPSMLPLVIGPPKPWLPLGLETPKEPVNMPLPLPEAIKLMSAGKVPLAGAQEDVIEPSPNP
jgi:hypothetical protein